MSLDLDAIARQAAGGPGPDLDAIARSVATPAPHASAPASSSALDLDAIARSVAPKETRKAERKPASAPAKVAPAPATGTPSTSSSRGVAPADPSWLDNIAHAAHAAVNGVQHWLGDRSAAPMPSPATPALGAGRRAPIESDRNATGADRSLTATALQRAGDAITLATPAGGVFGSVVADDVSNFLHPQHPRPGQPRGPLLGPAEAKVWQALKHGDLREANHAGGLFEGPTSTALGYGGEHGVIQRATRAIEKPLREGTEAASHLPNTGTVLDLGRIARAVHAAASTDPRLAESAALGVGEFAGSLVGPGNEIPGAVAAVAKAAPAKALGALARVAPKTAERIGGAAAKAGDALDAATNPYHDLLRDVHPADAEKARAFGRKYDAAPQAAKGMARKLLDKAAKGVTDDAQWARIVDTYQAQAYANIVRKATPEERAAAADLRAAHQQAVNAGAAIDPRIRIAGKSGDTTAFVKAALANGGHEVDADRALEVADAMEHAERMPANVSADERRRAALLAQNESITRAALAKYPGLLEDDEAVPGYYSMRGAWRFKDEVPGAPPAPGRRAQAVNTSYRNPARYRTWAEARQFGPGELGSTPFSNLSARESYLLDQQRKWENVYRQDAYQRLGALRARSTDDEGRLRTLREMPQYINPATGKPLEGAVAVTAGGKTRMVDPRNYAVRTADKMDSERARAEGLVDVLGPDFDPADIPKRRPKALTQAHLSDLRRAGERADGLTAGAASAGDKAVNRLVIGKAKQDAADVAGAARIGATVERGTQGVAKALGAQTTRALDAADKTRALTGELADRVRRAVYQRVLNTPDRWKPEWPVAVPAAKAKEARAALLTWAKHRVDNPAYQETYSGSVDRGDEFGTRVAVGRRGNADAAQGYGGSAFTRSDVQAARKEVEGILGARIPGSGAERDAIISGWLHDARGALMDEESRMLAAKRGESAPAEYALAADARTKRRVDQAANAVQAAGGRIADRQSADAINGMERSWKATDAARERTLKAVDRERLRTGRLRDTYTAATIGDIDRVVARVARGAEKFTDKYKSALLAQDLAKQKRAVVDAIEKAIETRKASIPRSGQDLIVHVPGYSKVSDLGLGIKDEPDAHVVDGLRRFLTKQRLSPDIATPVAENLSMLNSMARSSLVFNPVIHTIDNQGTIYMALTGDASGVRDATRAVFSPRAHFDDWFKSKKFSDAPGDTMRKWDIMAQDYGAWHETTHARGRMGTEASITRDESGAITGYKEHGEMPNLYRYQAKSGEPDTPLRGGAFFTHTPEAAEQYRSGYSPALVSRVASARNPLHVDQEHTWEGAGLAALERMLGKDEPGRILDSFMEGDDAATRELTLRGVPHDEAIRVVKMARDSGDDVFTDRVAAEEARKRGHDAIVTPHEYFALHPSASRPVRKQDDFATMATTPLGDIGGRGALHDAAANRDVAAGAKTLRARAEKVGYELQRWNSEVVFNRGERVYAAYLMRHFVEHEGLEPAAAANRVRDALGTDMLSEFERGASSGMFFFYPWVKTVVGLSLRLGISKPQTWNAPLEGTMAQREAVGADGVRMSMTNPYTVAAPDGQGGYGYYGLPIFNRVLEPLARMAAPPEEHADTFDRFGPAAQYALGHLAPVPSTALRTANEAIMGDRVPEYLQEWDPNASPRDAFLQAIARVGSEAFYPARAAGDIMHAPGAAVPAAVGGSLGHRDGTRIDALDAKARAGTIKALRSRIKHARQAGDQARLDRLESDLEYQERP